MPRGWGRRRAGPPPGLPTQRRDEHRAPLGAERTPDDLLFVRPLPVKQISHLVFTATTAAPASRAARAWGRCTGSPEAAQAGAGVWARGWGTRIQRRSPA